MEGTPQYLHFGFILISVANLIVILLLIAVFCAAVILRLPGSHAGPIREDKTGGAHEEDLG